MQTQENTQPRHDILILDPDAEFAGLVAQAIDDGDGTYRVTVDSDAQNVRSLVRGARAARRPFDLLIADVNALGSSSMQVIEELVQSSPELKIVTMTAFHSPELGKHLQQLNVCTHLVKPVLPSEIRQIVQDALAGSEQGSGHGSFALPLDSTQRSAVERELAALRARTRSTAALLVHVSGVIQALDCVDSGLDASALGRALMNAQRAVSRSLAQAMDAPAPVRQSFFGTDSYSVCVHRLDDAHVVATIFGPDAREGQMWFDMRGAVEALQAALNTGGRGAWRFPVSDRGEERGRTRNDGFEMVERYFAQQDSPSARPRQNPGERAPSPDNAHPAVDAPSLASLPESTAGGQERDVSGSDTAPSLLPRLEMERLEMDKVDWSLDGNQNWDALVADTGPAFQGLSFEEAKKRGLLDDLEASE